MSIDDIIYGPIGEIEEGEHYRLFRGRGSTTVTCKICTLSSSGCDDDDTARKAGDTPVCEGECGFLDWLEKRDDEADV